MMTMDPRELIGRYGTALAGLALILFFLIFAPNFASSTNIINVLKDTSFLAILALGFALAFTVAELDLSVAEVASLAASSASPVAIIWAPVRVHLTRPQAKSVAPAIQSTRLGMPRV